MTSSDASIDFRVGTATDVHRFDDSMGLALAGLRWQDERGLSGHSDADVALHALCDALFAAAGLGDLGTHFGTSQPKWAGAPSSELLSATIAIVREGGFEPVSASVQIIGNRPKFAPRQAEAQELVSGLVGCPVALSATTTDGLGLTGRGEGLAAISTALVRGCGPSPGAVA